MIQDSTIFTWYFHIFSYFPVIFINLSWINGNMQRKFHANVFYNAIIMGYLSIGG